MIKEVGVYYSFNPQEKGLRCFRYNSQCVLYGEDKKHLETVWVQGTKEDFLKLVDHWNKSSTQWRYFPVDEVVSKKL